MDPKEMNAEDLLQMAREDIARNRLTSAEKTLGQTILLNNQIPDAFYLLGQIYSRKGKLRKAILTFERALSLDPLHTEAAIALSSLYNDMGKYKEGAAVYAKTRNRLKGVQPGHDPRINKNLAQRHFELGQLYLKFERYGEAYREFAKASNLAPSNVDYSIRMATCLAKTGEKSKAIEHLKKVIELNPRSIEAKIQLGIMYHTESDLKNAHREWQGALALDPENRSAQMYLSMIDDTGTTARTV